MSNARLALVLLSACGRASSLGPGPRPAGGCEGAAPQTMPTSESSPRRVERLRQPVDGFYGKRILSGRIPILAHASVSDEAMQAAADRVEMLLAHAPGIRANLEAAHYELHISGLRQMTSELPEFHADRGTHLGSGELF